MARNIHGVHEPLVHISKREECGFFRACLVRLAAIALALVVCGVVIVALTGLNPVEVYAGVIDGAVGSGRRLWVTVRDTLSLLLVAVALTPAFKMRFWNVGGEGQVLIGATATAAVMINFAGKLPAPVLFAAMIGAGCERARQQTGVTTVALSGGVFQNHLLTRLTKEKLTKDGFTVLLHSLIPPNDGGICLGQAVAAMHHIRTAPKAAGISPSAGQDAAPYSSQSGDTSP